MRNDTATNANAFASTFYFFADTQGNAKKIKRACKPTHSDSADIRANSTDIALNVNRFGQTVSELQTVVLRTNSSTAYNIKIKRNNFFKGFVRLSKCVQVTNSFGYTNSRASNPLKKLLL